MAKWKKGQSGNLKGRPHGSKNRSTTEIKELLANAVPFDRLISKLYQLALRGNVRSAELLLAYRYGRPALKEEADQRAVQTSMVDLVAKAEATLANLNETSTEELQKTLLARLRLSSQGVKT